MPDSGDRKWLKSLAGYAAYLALVAAAGTLAYDLVAPDARATVIRLTSGLAAGIILLHLRARWREEIEGPGLTRVDSEADRPSVSQLYTNLHHDVRLSVQSRRYFETHLLPRLEKVAREKGETIDVPAPDRWRWSKRGPTLAQLSQAVERLERQA